MTDYSGTDNLEVMAEAVNYNDFLTHCVSQYAPESGQILDFGAGIGTFAKRLQERGFAVTCLEPDPKQASRLRLQGLPASESMDEIAAASLDYVYTLNVLEHIEHDAAALAQIAEKLKPGGRLLVYVPAFQILFSNMDRKVGHVRRYRRRELFDKVAFAGFNDIEARYVDSIGFFAALAYRLVGGETGAINISMLKFYDRYLFPLSRLVDRVLGMVLGKNVLLIATKA